MSSPAQAFSFVLNGEPLEVDGLAPTTTLLQFLRASGRTGTKEGCAEGDCGACSVAVVEADQDCAPTYRAINSCLTLLPMVAGRTLVTVEGVARDGALHPIQDAMVHAYGSQCGYCTPGFIMSLLEGYHRRDVRTPDDLDDQLCGNLCRCTGYRPIREAAAGAILGERPSDGLAPTPEGAARPSAMLTYAACGERFYRPTTLAELFAVRASEPDARLVAGATDLGLEVTKLYRRMPVLVSVEHVRELLAIEARADAFVVGGAVTLTRLGECIGEELPALGNMLRWFGSRQIRNRATIAGNLATASPIGDLAPVLLALDARVGLASPSGDREVALADYFLAYRKTALGPDEVIRHVVLPRGASAPGRTRKSASYKVSRRREMDISTVAAAFATDLDADGRIVHARLGYGGVAATPARARAVEDALLGRALTLDTARALAPALERAFTPISDHRGSARYRQRLVATLFERFVWEHAREAASVSA